MSNHQPLDPKQLARVQAMHKGFFFQHLYAAAALLLVAERGNGAVLVESDEDVEIEGTARHLYVQVKWRGDEVAWSDIATALDRFAALRREHEEGRRPGVATFAVVANVPPDATLRGRLADSTWPPDVALAWPGSGTAPSESPEPQASLSEALANVTELASRVPLTRLAAPTLALKLAAFAQYAATGKRRVDAGESRTLLEQVLVQTQAMPEPPDPYLPQANEVDFDPAVLVQWIVAPQGAGKTAWAAANVPLRAPDVAYFDAGRADTDAIISSLATELVAQLVPSRDGAIGTLLAPGRQGMAAISALDLHLERDGRTAFVVVDNAQVFDAMALGEIVRLTRALRWVLLSQPTPQHPLLEAALRCSPHELSGWDQDTVAHVLHTAGCRARAVDVSAVRDFTSGYPLFVTSFAQQAAQHYAGEVDRLVRDLHRLEHPYTTPQEALLARSVTQLPSDARRLLGALSLIDTPLPRQYLDPICLPLGVEQISNAIRSLSTIGAVETFGTGQLAVRDAFRLTGRQQLASETRETKAALRRGAYDAVLEAARAEGATLGRTRAMLRLLDEMGDVQAIADVATAESEWWRELGVDGEIAAMLARASDDASLSDADRFWAHDTLAFFAISDGRSEEGENRLTAMGQLLERMAIVPARMQATIASKRMTLAADHGDLATVEKVARETSIYLEHDRVPFWILRYNLARAYLTLGLHDKAEAAATALVGDYFSVLDLDPKDILFKSSAEVLKLLPPSWDSDDVKHLADALDLLAHARRAQGKGVGLAALHAAKLFDISHAISSAVRVGLDAARDFISGVQHPPDPTGALMVLENLVSPYIVEHKLFGLWLEARLLRARLWLITDRWRDAEREMDLIFPYVSALPEEERFALFDRAWVLPDLDE